MTEAAVETAERAQIYLVTPGEIALSTFPDQLAACLDRVSVACVRLALSSHDEGLIGQTADRLRTVTEARDVALVIEKHFVLAERLGLDGVHLTDGARSIKAARKALGEDAIVGSFCGTSRHDGMTAAEMGADYVSFGPVSASALGDGTQADADLFDWWSEMIEVPVVAEGLLQEGDARDLAARADFVALGDLLWQAEDPAARLEGLAL